MKVSDFPERECKIMIIKMFTKNKREMYEQNKNFN